MATLSTRNEAESTFDADAANNFAEPRACNALEVTRLALRLLQTN